MLYENVIFVLGLRRVGKTHMLRQLANDVEGDRNSKTTHNLKKVFPDERFIRVVTDKELTETRSSYHVIHHPLALLKLSNGTIFELDACTATADTVP